jgi:hypothetical protein
MWKRLALPWFLLLVACTTGPQPAASTSVPTTTTTVPATPQGAATSFQACLTGRGFDVPEIPLDDDGRPDLSVLGPSIDQTSSEWRSAISACAGDLTQSGALDLSDQPELAAAVTAELRTFSTCMRSQGVEEFPDPRPDFDGSTPPYPLADIPITDPDLAPAIEACASVVGTNPLG